MTGNKWYQTYGDPGPLSSSDPLFKKLEILKFEDVYKLHVGKFIFSCLSHLTPPVFWDWFTINTDVHNYATTSNTVIVQNEYFDVGTVSQNLTLHRRACNKESYGVKMVRVLGPVLWNNLPRSLRESDLYSNLSETLLLGGYSDV